MIRTVLLASASLALLTSASSAADLMVAPAVQPVVYSSSGFDWSGFYAGVVGGYSWGNGAYTAAGGPTYTNSPNGGQIGLTAGFNGQFDQFVLGAEGEILWSGAEGSVVGAPAPAVAPVIRTRSEWQGAVKLRAGVAVDRVLIYAHGGLAFADVNSDVLNAVGTVVTNNRTGRTGFTVGVGAEFAVTDNVSIKAEYAYSDFGKFTGTFNPGALNADIHYTSHAIKAGINFHF